MVRLVVGERATAVRRDIGATAWAALEELAMRDDSPSRDCVAASIRDIADALGIAKNTAHRAMRRLVDAGLASPLQPRANDGRYVAGIYRLTVDPDVLHVAIDEPASRATTPRPHARRSQPLSDRGIQLDLLASRD